MILKTNVFINTIYAIGKDEFNIRKLTDKDKDENEKYTPFNLNLLFVVHYYQSNDGKTVVVLSTEQHLKLDEDFDAFEKLMFLVSPVRQLELISPHGTVSQRTLNVHNNIVSEIVSLE